MLITVFLQIGHCGSYSLSVRLGRQISDGFKSLQTMLCTPRLVFIIGLAIVVAREHHYISTALRH
jgi:hypothetical protein